MKKIEKFRKKPVIIEAIQWDGSFGENLNVIVNFCLGKIKINKDNIYLQTLEGELKISPFDFVIKGVQGEFYPCKPDIFAETYEKTRGGGLDG